MSIIQESIDDDRTRIELRPSVEPEGPVESVADPTATSTTGPHESRR